MSQELTTGNRCILFLMSTRRFLLGGWIVSLLFMASSSLAYADGQLVPEKVTIMKGEVLEIITQEEKNLPGTDTRSTFQTIKARILDGEEKGKEVTIENDHLNLQKGEVFYVTHTVDTLGDYDYYTITDPYRLPQLLGLVGLFVFLVFIFGGKQGVRGLVSLAGSFLFIFYILLPAILHGYSPLLVTVGVSSLIITVGSYVTHGFTRSTSAAVIGMIATVSLTGFLAYVAVHLTRLTGFGSEEAMYLNLNTRGSIDVLGILLGGIIIGLLGVLYDAAIGQAVSVEELHRIAPHMPRKVIYTRALRIGREHIGALVNTLAIAYVGASLPLLLLFYQTSSASFAHIANTEIFATEIVRIMIGSIGLVLAVPVTTVVSTWMLVRKKEQIVDDTELKKERDALEHAGHSHGH